MSKSERLAKLIKLIETDKFKKSYGEYHEATFKVDRNLENIEEELILAGQESNLTYLAVTTLPRIKNSVVRVKWIYDNGKSFEAYRGFEGATLCMGESLKRDYDIVEEAMTHFSF